MHLPQSKGMRPFALPYLSYLAKSRHDSTQYDDLNDCGVRAVEMAARSYG